jgi:predicted outer membrane repeat protein
MRRVLLVLLVLLVCAAPAQAEVINVTTTGESPNGFCPSATQCTVRAALALARSNGVSTADTINLPAGEYLLNAELDAGTSLRTVAFVGAGADKTIIRGNGTRVLRVGGESWLILQGVTLAGGNPGIRQDGGNVLVGSSAILQLDHVRITGGTATRGGGIANDNGTVAGTHVLLDNNTATSDGGAIASYATGGLALRDSTIAGNRAGTGGGIAVSDLNTTPTTLTRVTLALNTSLSGLGGGLAVLNQASAPAVQGSIIAANRGQIPDGGQQVASNCTGTDPVDNGGNLESLTDCGFTSPNSRQTPNTGLAETLADDGGTMPVLRISAESPARDLAGACADVTDLRDVPRPQGAACDAGAYEYVAPPPVVEPTPTPAAIATTAPTPTPTAAPAPVVNRTIVVAPVRGTVKVKLPGTTRYVDLTTLQGIPVGSTVDTRKGRVTLTSIPRAGAPPETAVFWDGLFRVTQAKGITNLTLVEALAKCSTKANASAKKAKKRRLWGDGKGAFRTSGRYSAATVRGTKWLVEDSCAGTLTRVTQGSVSVRHRSRTIIVRAGKRYLARPRR